jgi:hypothetical protein
MPRESAVGVGRAAGPLWTVWPSLVHRVPHARAEHGPLLAWCALAAESCFAGPRAEIGPMACGKLSYFLIKFKTLQT